MFTRRQFLAAIPAPYGVANSQAIGGMVREYHVSPRGSDQDQGTLARPLRTISAAAARAQAGDTITMHQGV